MSGAAGHLPSFLGLGCQKGGTTTLQLLLEQHPRVFLPPVKEVQYFSLHSAEGVNWYGQHYAEAPATALCGDITPYYLFHPEVPRRVAALLPEVRLIALLRDPVERTLSHYFHACRMGFEHLPLEQALAAETERLAGAERVLRVRGGRHGSHQEHSYVARSRYEVQLLRWQALFRPEQLLLVRSEQLFIQPQAVWSQVLAFLDLPELPLPGLGLAANAGLGEAALVGPEVRRALRDQLAPTYAWLEAQGLVG